MNINEKLKMLMAYGNRFIGAYSKKEINSASILFAHYHKKLEKEECEIEKGKLYTFLMLQDEVGFNAIYKKINELSYKNTNISWEDFCSLIDHMPLRQKYKQQLA
ncbi:hypothetical protein ACOP1M_00085 [Staphylococcus warneri]|uniref:hypothetical protein n=1 Tax=Staphylococcus warneri TaxID=1292 RepID=UPI003CE92FE3